LNVANLYSKIGELTAKGEPFAVLTLIRAEGSTPRGLGAKMIVLRDGSRMGSIGGDCLENDSVDEALKMLKDWNIAEEKAEKPPVKIMTMVLDEQEAGGLGMVCGGKVDVLIEVVKPELHLVVLGSGPVATSIVKLADFLDITSTIVDPIPPEVKLPASVSFLQEEHEAGVRMVPCGSNSAIVIVTRHKDDVPSLRAAFSSNAGYIGLIGSRHRVQTVFEKAASELGISGDEVARKTHAPVGLDIGARTPREIALSVLAEILTHFRSATGRPKRSLAVAEESKVEQKPVLT
jgi:xanthine dehydrogenase accessory factor